MLAIAAHDQGVGCGERVFAYSQPGRAEVQVPPCHHEVPDQGLVDTGAGSYFSATCQRIRAQRHGLFLSDHCGRSCQPGRR